MQIGKTPSFTYDQNQVDYTYILILVNLQLAVHFTKYKMENLS